MTLKQWQLIACFALLAAFVVLGASLVRQAASERAGRAATAVIDRLTLRLDTAQAIAVEAQAAAQIFQRERDSLLKDARAPRTYVRRQLTPIALDTGDVPAVVAVIATLAAERDTALADRDSARADTERLRIKLLVLDSLASRDAAADAVRWGRVAAIIDSAQVDAHAVRAIVRPRWYRRLAGGLGRTSKVLGIATIAFFAGRAT